MGLREFSAELHLREAASASATSPVFTAHSHRALQPPARCTLSLRVGQQPVSHRTSSPPSPLPLSPRARLSDEPTFTTCHHHACFSRQPRSRFTRAPQSAVPLSPHARTAPTSATGRSLTTSPRHTRQSCTAVRSHGTHLSHQPRFRQAPSPVLLTPRARTAAASATLRSLATFPRHTRLSRQPAFATRSRRALAPHPPQPPVPLSQRTRTTPASPTLTTRTHRALASMRRHHSPGPPPREQCGGSWPRYGAREPRRCACAAARAARPAGHSLSASAAPGHPSSNPLT